MSSASILVSRITWALAESKAVVLAAANASERQRRLHLLLEPLQRPVAAPLHVGGHAGQRHDRADLGALAGELEVRHVALDAVVIGGERARARELDGPVLAHEPAARSRGSGHEQHRYGDEHPEQRDPSHDESLLSIVRPSGHDEELDDGERRSGSRISRLPSCQRDCRCVFKAVPMPGTVIVGTHWGDEGKGRFTDYLAKESALVVRYQAGHNAGHTHRRRRRGVHAPARPERRAVPARHPHDRQRRRRRPRGAPRRARHARGARASTSASSSCRATRT